MSSKCICETLYDKCVEQVKSSLSTSGFVFIDRHDSKNPCNNKMIQHMVEPFFRSFDNDLYRVTRKSKDLWQVEPDGSLWKNQRIVTVPVSIAISNKEIFG